MISKLERRQPHFSHRVSAVKYSREARAPSVEIARQLEDVIRKEVRMLEADEKGADNRKSSWKSKK
eukprot:2183453-Prorocentrum_lima.AAC.1